MLSADGRFESVHARRRNDAELADELSRLFMTRRSAYWIERLCGAGIACSPVNEGGEWFFDEPHYAKENLICDQQHPVIGWVKLSHNLVKLANTLQVETRPTPLLGEHGRQALKEMGYSAEQIHRLYEDGVAKTEKAGDVRIEQ